MLKAERHRIILGEAEKHHRVKSLKLCELFDVSKDTIRRDLQELDKKGKLKKVHGGAMRHSFMPGFLKDDVQEIQSKQIASKKAISLIEDGQVIIIDGGTSNLQLTAMLPHDKMITIFTNSIPVAYKLCEYPNIEGILLGGNILTEGRTTSGYPAVESLQEIHADMCFLGIAGVDPDFGLTEANRQETTIKKAMLKASNTVVSLTISNNLNSRQPYKVCDISYLDIIVTELDPSDNLLAPFDLKGIRIL